MKSALISSFALLATTFAAPALAAPPDPCGGINLVDGRVVSARPIRATEKPAEIEGKCLDAIGKALGDRSAIRSVTISVRLPDAQRAAGAGARIGAVVQKSLVSGGVPDARISVVVPSATDGEKGTVAISFTEKLAKRSVAVIESMGGTVTAGPDRSALAPVQRGSTLNPDTYVYTGAGSTAWIGLADGSRLRLSQNSLLLIGRLHLNDKLERVVRLQLVNGDLEAHVRSDSKSSVFDVQTRFGTAGVRGTRFRLSATEQGTRLETLEGAVELAGTEKQKALIITKDQGASMAPGGDAKPVTSLLVAPVATGPLKGAAERKGKLVWQPVDGAKGYAIEVARDAEFTFDVRRYDSAGTEMGIDEKLETGKWFWRVAAVDQQTFVGATSKVHAFELAQ